MEEIIDNINIPEIDIKDPLNISFETTEENLKYTLSKEDFEEYFSWNEIYQENVWDCRLVSPIMSLVEFWGYERLIRTSVKKDENGFKISLPLWSPEPYTYFISFEEINQVQLWISWDAPSLVDWKLWIQALVLAYWKMCTWKDQFDYINLDGWSSNRVFNDLIYGIEVYEAKRKKVSYDKDPHGSCDKNFLNHLYDILENFNEKTDMIVLSVSVDLLTNALWHYSNSNHSISVKKVKKENWKLVITVWNLSEDYEDCDVTFEDLITSCARFFLWTTKERPWLKKSNKSYIWKRKYCASAQSKNIDKVESVNQVVQLHWKGKEFLREARGDIIVTDMEYNVLKVSSYGLDTKVEERDWMVIISVWTNELYIDKSLLSNKYEYNREIIANADYPFYLYWAKIANFVNMMRNFYINPKKWDEKNEAPFSLIDWVLQFDDNPKSFKSTDRIKRKFKELIWDDYIECLRDWESLWINPLDDEIKQKIVDFLNQLVENKRTTS